MSPIKQSSVSLLSRVVLVWEHYGDSSELGLQVSRGTDDTWAGHVRHAEAGPPKISIHIRIPRPANGRWQEGIFADGMR